MLKPLPYIIATFIAVTMVYAQTENIEADKDSSSITYHIYHFFHSVDGVSKEISCFAKIDSNTHKIKSVNVTAMVLMFNSGNSSRDKTAMEAIDAPTYPRVAFQSDSISYTSDSTLNVIGKLSFHGITREISFPLTMEHKSGETICDGGFEANFSDYKVERPSLLLISIGDKFGVKFHVVFKGTF